MADNLDDYVRGASQLYEVVKERYIAITGEVPPTPDVPLLLDKSMQDLPSTISNKMGEYRQTLIAGMESDPSKAKAYLNTTLYIVFQATFCTKTVKESQELYDRYADAADSVWDGMHRDYSIDQLLTWIADNMK